MIINSKQITQLGNKIENEFIKKVLIDIKQKYPTWALKKDIEIESFIKKWIKDSEKYNIEWEESIEKLIHYFIIYELSFPLDLKVEFYLKQYMLENEKLEVLYLFLESDRYNLIEILLDSVI